MVQIFMWDLENVSTLWSVRFRVSALERFCYKGFLRSLSGTKFFVRLREVSVLEDIRFREVPLYRSFLYKSFPSKNIPNFGFLGKPESKMK